MSTPYPSVPSPVLKRPRRLVREMAVSEQPAYRLQAHGPRALATAELLALILGTADAHDLAQELLAAAGSLRQLGRYTTTELCRFTGVGAALAGRIRAACELAHRLTQTPAPDRPRLTSPAAAWAAVRDMATLEQEHLVILSLNTRNELLARDTVYKGNVNSSIIRAAEVVRRPIRHNASAFILAHNHPSQDPSPSPEDAATTRHIRQAAELLDLTLLDHIIVGGGRYVSLKEKKLGF